MSDFGSLAAATAFREEIGNTPLVATWFNIAGRNKVIWLKLECCNPAGSLKTRTAASLIDDLERRRLIGSSSVVIESTSGNLGVALAHICGLKGLRFRAVVDPRLSPEIGRKITDLGAQLETVNEPDENGGYLLSRLHRVQQLCAMSSQYVWTNQYANLANPLAHYLSTAPEIYKQMEGKLDAVFVAVSTGGTLAGVGRYFREMSPKTRIVGVDAKGSVIFGGPPGRRNLTGIGSSRKSDFLKPDIFDSFVIVDDQQSFSMCRRLARGGLKLGGSSGAVLVACARYLSENPQLERCVCICPDGGDNYQSTIFTDEWMLNNGFTVNEEVEFVTDMRLSL